MSKWPVRLDREIWSSALVKVGGKGASEIGLTISADNSSSPHIPLSSQPTLISNSSFGKQATFLPVLSFDSVRHLTFGPTPAALYIMTLADESPPCVERGVESEAQLANLSEPDVGKVLTHLVNQQSGAGVAWERRDLDDWDDIGHREKRWCRCISHFGPKMDRPLAGEIFVNWDDWGCQVRGYIYSHNNHLALWQGRHDLDLVTKRS